MLYHMPKFGITALLAILILTASLASHAGVVVYLGEQGSPYAYDHPYATDPESALNALAVVPTDNATGKLLTTAIPAGTRVLGITMDGETVVVNFSSEIASALNEAQLERIFEQVRDTLWAYGFTKSVKIQAAGKLLSDYLPKMATVLPSAESVMRSAAAASGAPIVGLAGLSGKMISLSPGHGRVWLGSYFANERGVYCAPLNAEDDHNVELTAYLNAYLMQDGATVKNYRCLDKTAGASPYDNGRAWWEMSASYWLKQTGYPCSVYAGSTGDCTLGSGASETSDSISGRPRAANYDNTDVHISMHTNGLSGNCYGATCPNGTCTYYDSTTGYGGVSQPLAQSINGGIVNAIRGHYPNETTWRDRGALDSAGGFAETRVPTRPSVLIELAFHDSCDRDGLYLNDNFFRSLTMWGVYKGVCDYLGRTPTWDLYSNEVVSHDIPATMIAGEIRTVHVTMRNRGVLWNSAHGFSLGAAGDSDPFTTAGRQPISGEVGPNQTYTFTFNLQAPTTTGTYTTDWRMLREWVAWFGPTVSQTVTVTGGSVDMEPPTVPQNLRSLGVSANSVSIAWDASTDNAGVTGYSVYRNGGLIGTTPSLTYTDTSAAMNTIYTYEVAAYDARPNYSAKSTAIQVTTPSVVTEMIIESRSGGQNYSSYAEVGGFANGSPASTAAGCTQGIGFRYSSALYAGRYANYTFSPSIGLVPGTYNVYATWGKYGSNPAVGCSAIKYDFDGVFTGSTHDQSVNWNTWQQVGGTTGILTAANHVVKQYYDGTYSGKWLIANAVKMVLQSQAFLLTLTPSPSPGGTCIGGGYKLPGSTSISAASNTGWTFTKWSNNAAGTDTVSTASPYTHTIPAYNQTLYAIFSDTAAPTGSVVINSAAQYARSSTVTLTLSASDPYSGTGLSQMRFNNENGAWSSWETFTTSKTWSLSAGDGSKTVYAQFKDAAGNISTGTISDGITLDTVAPTISIGAPSVSSTAGGPVTYQITYSGANAVTLANGNVTLNKNLTADAGSVVVSGSGLTTRTVTLSSIIGNGTLGISIAAGTASDMAGNTAPLAGPSATFNVLNNLQSYALINKAVADEIMVDASSRFLFTIFGKVIPINADSFSVDDGSSMPVKVIFTEHGFTGVDYVSATGTLDVSNPALPVLTAQVVKKLN